MILQDFFDREVEVANFFSEAKYKGLWIGHVKQGKEGYCGMSFRRHYLILPQAYGLHARTILGMAGRIEDLSLDRKGGNLISSAGGSLVGPTGPLGPSHHPMKRKSHLGRRSVEKVMTTAVCR